MKIDFSVVAVSGEMRVWLKHVTFKNPHLELFQFYNDDLPVTMARPGAVLIENKIFVNLAVHDDENCTSCPARMPADVVVGTV